MPIYDYICSTCSTRIEVIHGIHDPGPVFCPSCGAEGTLRKALTTPAVHFKGAGWAKKDRSSMTAGARAPSGEGGSDGEGATAGGDRASDGGGSSDGGVSSDGGRGKVAPDAAKPSAGDSGSGASGPAPSGPGSGSRSGSKAAGSTAAGAKSSSED